MISLLSLRTPHSPEPVEKRLWVIILFFNLLNPELKKSGKEKREVFNYAINKQLTIKNNPQERDRSG